MECGEKVKPRKNWRRRRKPWVKEDKWSCKMDIA
jgi:hypothetical protein